jgi:hypothetical protein
MLSVCILLVLLILVVLPTWPYSRRWGYVPSILLTILLILVVLLF